MNDGRKLVIAALATGGLLWATHQARAVTLPAGPTRTRPARDRKRPRPGPNAVATSKRRPRGRKVSTSSTDAGGNVRESPAELLAQAQRFDGALTLDEYAAARMAASEHASGSMAELVAMIDAQLNRATARGQSIVDSLTRGHGFGRQGRKRRVATTRDPFEIHLEAARQVLRTGSARGASRGARRFFDPRTQLTLWRQGKTCHPLVILERWSFARPWAREGGARRDPRDSGGRRTCPLDRTRTRGTPEAWIGELAGIDSTRLMLFRPLALGDAHAAAYARARQTIIDYVSGPWPTTPRSAV